MNDNILSRLACRYRMVWGGGIPKWSLPKITYNGSLSCGTHIHQFNGFVKTNFNHFITLLVNVIGGDGRRRYLRGLHQQHTRLRRAGVCVGSDHIHRDVPDIPIIPCDHCRFVLVREVIGSRAGNGPSVLDSVWTNGGISHRVSLAGRQTVLKVLFPQIRLLQDIFSQHALGVKIGIDVQVALRLCLCEQHAAKQKRQQKL